MLGTDGEMAEIEPPEQLAHAAFVEFDAKLGRNAVSQIGTPEPHHAIAGEFGALFDPGRKLALLDPAQAGGAAASRPVSKPFQPFLIVAVNPVAQRLAVHAAKPRCLLAAETIEHHGYGQDARRLFGIRRCPCRRTQIGGTHIRSSNRYRSHIHPRESMLTASSHKMGPKGIPPSTSQEFGPLVLAALGEINQPLPIPKQLCLGFRFS
jgi:hypothetical protein